MFIPGDDAFLLKCKTDKRSLCFEVDFWKTEDKTGVGGKPSKGGNGIWWCSSNKVVHPIRAKKMKYRSSFPNRFLFGMMTP